ncbi:hypothetical protein B7755_041390 [Streptomyces sp. NBS 14/10]|uniref:hypothetical protein n=1 Tax=Streptomyces sp. NBS 14/10 TaxID=1945643 RepID=UPI00118047F2|nr:hypothetical protein [Streptomyces sp. NBS 14/10]KAK1183999.1 hypothetical protein B7755_041390 [Streptomyces sp. NBS 14/10]
MTTPPLTGPPSVPPGGGVPPAPQAVARPGNRRTMVAVVVSVLVLVGGGVTAWWLTRDEDSSSLADRPRVKDDKAGISYAIPEGWQPNKKGDLVDAFTSSITMKSTGDEEEGGSVVLAGRAGTVPKSQLKEQTEDAARSNAEYFYPDGRSSIEESRATTVSDRPAYTVALKVSDGEGGTGHLRLTLMTARDGGSSYLLGIAQPTGPQEQQEVDAVLESASLS